MASGGARNRSGPPADPRSARSDSRGLRLKTLPANGYDGEIPDFPMPGAHPRALEWWAWAWRTPQAAAWATDRESWRIPSVAEWCHVKAILEGEEAPTGLWAAKFRLEDRTMLSNAGLIEAGYTVAADEVGEKREAKAAPTLTAVPEYDPRAEMGGA